MADYVYTAYDLRTNVPVADLPLSRVTWSRELNEDGELTAFIGPDAARGRADLAAVLPGRTAIYVRRDGQFMGAYFLAAPMRRTPAGAEIAAGSCRGMLSYFHFRRLAATLTYTQVDQLQIARNLVAAVDAAGNIGLETEDTIMSTVLRDRTYAGSELKDVREALLQLGEVDHGFDLAVDVETGPDGDPRLILRLSYPRRGRTVADSGLTLEYPGAVLDYDWAGGGSPPLTTVYGIGTGDGEAALRATATNPDLLTAGWPVLEGDLSITDVSLQATLDAHTRAAADAAAGTVTTPSLSVTADNPPLGSYLEGDEVRLRILDDVFGGPGPVDVDVTGRLTGFTVSVSDDGAEQVQWTLDALVAPL